jgi:DNA-directed RNA polymerase specialized sigma24 family protein
MRRFNFDLSRSEIEHLIDEWILNQRNREILKRRLLDGITYERLAEEFDMSVRQIKTIVYRSEDKLFRKMEKG